MKEKSFYTTNIAHECQKNKGLARPGALLMAKKRPAICGSFATGQNRTDDIRIFSPALYQLSYSGV